MYNARTGELGPHLFFITSELCLITELLLNIGGWYYETESSSGELNNMISYLTYYIYIHSNYLSIYDNLAQGDRTKGLDHGEDRSKYEIKRKGDWSRAVGGSLKVRVEEREERGKKG